MIARLTARVRNFTQPRFRNATANATKGRNATETLQNATPGRGGEVQVMRRTKLTIILRERLLVRAPTAADYDFFFYLGLFGDFLLVTSGSSGLEGWVQGVARKNDPTRNGAGKTGFEAWVLKMARSNNWFRRSSHMVIFLVHGYGCFRLYLRHANYSYDVNKRPETCWNQCIL